MSLTWDNADFQDLHELRKDTFQVKATSTRRLVGDAALEWSQTLKVEVGGTGTVAKREWCCRGCWLIGSA